MGCDDSAGWLVNQPIGTGCPTLLRVAAAESHKVTKMSIDSGAENTGLKPNICRLPKSSSGVNSDRFRLAAAIAANRFFA